MLSVGGAASYTQSLVVTETLVINGQTTTLTLSGPTNTYTQAISVVSAASTTCGAVTVTVTLPAPLSYVTAYMEHSQLKQSLS